jgi:tetratricopeptide (TPR) repeat protein
MKHFLFLLTSLLIFISCRQEPKWQIDREIMSHLGAKHRIEWERLAQLYEDQYQADSTNVQALFNAAETRVGVYIFGFSSREDNLPAARNLFERGFAKDSISSASKKMKGILHFLDWEWEAAESAFKASIVADGENLSARHWYALYLMAMMRHDEAMEQSDIIMSMDDANQFMIGRGSMLYFTREFEEMKVLMKEAVAYDTTVAWSYDWLGMAHIELKEYEQSIETYFKAFHLSDGTVEVGGGLGHALGQAGEYELAKQMTDYYDQVSDSAYLPSVQRAFIHIGIKEYEKALELLEQAYLEKSWFLIFVKTEPWYDPIRRDPELNRRFVEIIEKLEYPE